MNDFMQNLDILEQYLPLLLMASIVIGIGILIYFLF